MITKLTVLLTGFLVSNSTAFSQAYILNPSADPSFVSPRPITKTDEIAWLKNFYAKINLTGSADPQLQAKIKEATRLYLESKLDSAMEQTERCLNDISLKFPYASLRSDLVDILSLKLLILSSQKTSPLLFTDIPGEIRPWLKSNEFLAKLPVKLQAHVGTLENPHPSAYPSGAFKNSERVFFDGAELAKSARIIPGRYLIHQLVMSELQARWVDLTGGEVNLEPLLWTRSIWTNLPQKNLRSALESSKPPHLEPASIGVLLKSENRTPKFLMLSSLESGNSSAGFFDSQTDLKLSNLAEEKSSILQSPWFWFLTASLAGTAGYFIYDASQTKTARGP